MSQQPGWYPNPDGTPQSLRFWDGTQWTSQIMAAPQSSAPYPNAPGYPPAAAASNPSAPYPNAPGYPPAAAASNPSAPYPNAPGYPAAASAPAKRPIALYVIGGIAAAVVVGLVAWFALAGLFGAKPEPPPATPTAVPSATTAGGTASARPCPTPAAGTLSDGFATLTLPSASWQGSSRPAWAPCGYAAARRLVGTWATLLGVGTVVNADHNPEATANAMLRWAQQTGYHSGAQPTVVSSAPITVQGKPAWKLQGRIQATPHDGISGGTWTFVVVPHGDGTSSVVYGVSAIEDVANAAEIDAALATLKLR